MLLFFSLFTATVEEFPVDSKFAANFLFISMFNFDSKFELDTFGALSWIYVSFIVLERESIPFSFNAFAFSISFETTSAYFAGLFGSSVFTVYSFI